MPSGGPASGQTDSVIAERFVLEREHKRGGMGTVWKGRDRLTQQPVALKLLHASSAEQSQRFAREAALLADLSHRSIVAYVAHGVTEAGVPYLAMEWLEGENVADRLARQAPTMAESLTLVQGAARALALAHRRGIVHRDLKPSNLFLRAGRVDDVVLLDLGIARLVDGADALTRTGSILGTPHYMAPEQAQGGHSQPGPAVDVFSLGCVLFECLTGDPPFVGAHVFSVLAKVLFEEAPRLRDVRPELPEALEVLLERMLIKDPARRLPDAAAVLAAMDALEGLPDVEAPRPAAVAADAGAGRAEQELVSVLLAIAAAGAPEPPLPDVAPYGGECKRLVDGTTVVTLAQRGGAATDLAARAARCALRLRDGGASWKIALATGRGIPTARVYIGEAVDRAATLLRELTDWSGGSIWVDEITAGLLDARFRTSRVNERAFALEGEDPSIDPGRRLMGRPTTCVGRDHELAMLQLTLDACFQESSPRATLVVGPPGMGKSRLRHELVRHLETRGSKPLLLLGQGDPIRTSTTCGLLGSALARLCGIKADQDEEQNRAALEERVGRHLGGQSELDRRRTTVFLGELTGVGYPAGASPELRAARQDPHIMADQVAQAWLAFLHAETAAGPVLVVLDDLQWSDALTVSLVGAALRQLSAAPLMVLGLGRPEVVELFPDLWSPRLTTLPLNPLGSAAMQRLIRQVLGADVSPEAVSRIVSRAGGNALYLEELIRAAEAQHDAVPETVLAMLQARIGLLPAAPRRVLRAASVFGENFPLGGVEAVLRHAGAHGDLEPALAALGKNEILEQQADEQGGRRWRFRHALMRDAAYGLMTGEDLTSSHALAARFLEGSGEDPAVVASHFERAGDRPAAVRHTIAAAEAASRRNDLPAVMTLVRQGLACGAAGPDRGILRCVEAETRFYQHDFAGSWEAAAEALTMLPTGHAKRIPSLAWYTFVGVQLGKATDIQRETEEFLAADPGEEDRASYVRAIGYRAISLCAVADRAAAIQLLDRLAALDAAFGDSDPLLRGHALYCKLRFEELLGDDPHLAWTLARRAIPCHERSGDRRTLAFSRAEIGECARRLYSVDEGKAELRVAVKLGFEIREPVTIAFIQQYLSTLLAEHGTAAELPDAFAQARSVMEQAGVASAYRAFGQISLALAHLRAGELAAAEDQARQAHSTIHGLGLRAYYPHVDSTLLQVLLAKGDTAVAGELADLALQAVEVWGPMGLLEMPLRLWAARAHAACGRVEDARRGVNQALQHLARRAGAIPDRALRDKFLTAVPEHVALRALGRQLVESAASADPGQR